ncbi:prolactin-releasing peptide receptor [Fopius arisanus]|uniref:Prolactin-releasing peptide receptor n=2 Tax=Fopius arisanus TaxID=64838 RepID=A0A9R1TZ53_9HYME|nr:PREDICTED: prolactin-releasing peptide receptor [Fopius arisanus]
MRPSRSDLDSIPDQYLETIAHYLMGLRNDTVDLSKPQLRPSFTNNYPLFILLYVLMITCGTATNIGMIYHIMRHRLYQDPTYAYLINIAISDVVKCIFVLPITLAVLLVQNWIFGKFLCYFLPMLQDIPIHVSMMTYLLIAGDRYRFVSVPGKPRIPAFVCALGIWFFAVCIVLPYAIYTTYLDLETYKKLHFRGLGICLANLTDDIQQYMRSLFLLTYIAPLTVTAYLYVKASRELQDQDEPMAVAMFEARAKNSYSRHDSNTSHDVTSLRDGKRESGSMMTGGTVGLSGFSTTYDLYDAELDVRKEKRTQKYLIFMVSVFAILLCPLMVLRLAKPALVETYENTGHFDITFIMFVWLGFASTVTTPVLYASWQMSRPAKERLKGYFQFSTKRLPPVLEKGLRHGNRHEGGLANVAYTPQARAGSLSGSNGSDEYPRGTSSFQRPDLINNAQRMSPVH